MELAVQQAYYLNAQNPSDDDILVQLGSDIGIDKTEFITELNSECTQSALASEIRFARSIGGNSFPSWILVKGDRYTHLPLDYKDESLLVTHIKSAFSK